VPRGTFARFGRSCRVRPCVMRRLPDTKGSNQICHVNRAIGGMETGPVWMRGNTLLFWIRVPFHPAQ